MNKLDLKNIIQTLRKPIKMDLVRPTREFIPIEYFLENLFSQTGSIEDIANVLIQSRYIAIYDQFNSVEAQCLHCNLPQSARRSLYFEAQKEILEYEDPDALKNPRWETEKYTCIFCIEIDCFWTKASSQFIVHTKKNHDPQYNEIFRTLDSDDAIIEWSFDEDFQRYQIIHMFHRFKQATSVDVIQNMIDLFRMRLNENTSSGDYF